MELVYPKPVAYGHENNSKKILHLKSDALRGCNLLILESSRSEKNTD
jgi:hypothetical protein